MKHYDEIELLELEYLPAAQSAEAQAHVATCLICAARRKTVAETMQQSRKALDDVVASKPDTFWKRQQLAVSRAALAEKHQRHQSAPRLAAAAAILMIL